ncbi:MAG TPA: hypothetical protein VFM38_09470 [Candidatus Limnocylindrales bacterium]|nr:hypothetical protein [Candidatus Limnocylindrales bacterium]
MDLLTTIVIVLIAAALIGWLAAAIDGRPLEAFGSGFIGYRSYGWPRGVQEEDGVRFSPTAWHDQPSADDDPTRPLASPELIELDERSADPIDVERLR